MNSDEFSDPISPAIDLAPVAPQGNESTIGMPLVPAAATLSPKRDDLAQQVAALQAEVATLQATRDHLQTQTQEAQATLSGLMQAGLKELEQRQQVLQLSVEQLERRQERIRNEMRTTFAGASQDIAVRVQSFKDYLVGSLQDLALAAEQLEFQPVPLAAPVRSSVPVADEPAPALTGPKFAEQTFQEQTKRIRNLLDQFRTQPDYYGPVWKLRRTFEPIHADRVSEWFFTQGGRGAVRTMGSRLQNILVASAVISIMYALYGDRLRALVLANTPERLGEWRRGLQDCLGVSRSDFGSDRGLSLFESPESLVFKAERLQKENLMPLIIIDETEDVINLALLQFPLWLAFAPTPQPIQPSSYLY